MDEPGEVLKRLIDDRLLPEPLSLDSLRRRSRERSRRWVLGGSVGSLAVAVALIVWLMPVVPRTPSNHGPSSVSFTFEASAKASDRVLTTSAKIVRERALTLAGSQSSVSVRGQSIIVQVPTSKATNAVLSAIAEPGSFYFRQVLCGAPAYTPPTGPSAYRVPSGCPKTYAYQPSSQGSAGSSSVNFPAPDPAFASYPTTAPIVDSSSPNEDVILAGGPGAMAPRYVLGPALADASIIKDVRVEHLTVTDEWVVLFDFTATGSATFDRIASSHYGTQIADDFDGRILTAPIIETRTSPGSGEISGDFTKAGANALAVALTYGALPVALRAKTAT